MNTENQKVSLREVKRVDFRFLYDLLAERESTANISHRKMPTYEEHVKFVMSKPYTKWYVIYHRRKKVGSIYLSKQDEIGIFIKKEMQGEGIGGKAIKLLMKKNPRSRYLANVAPRNVDSGRFFKNNGFTLVQYTYELLNAT